MSPHRQAELARVLADTGDRVLRHLPGFLGPTIEVSLDGTRVVNHAHWASAEALSAMQHDRACRAHMNWVSDGRDRRARALSHRFLPYVQSFPLAIRRYGIPGVIMRVVIIGGGLGGLALAHGLRAANIEVTVHERSPRTGPQPASYGIHINDHGNRALHACLPAENWALFDQSSVAAPNVVRFRDRSLGVLTSLELSSPAEVVDPIAHRRAVRRQNLHRALLHGLDDVVNWGKTFESYTVQADRRVRVGFDDGTSTVGDLLVGADGSNSRVRRQYLPELVRHDLGILNIAGRLPLSHPAALALPRDMVDGSVNNVVPTGPGWLFASTWPASGRDALDDDFLVWAYAAARDAYPADVDALSPRQLQWWVVERVAGWDPRVARMVGDSMPDTVAPVALRSMSTLPTWPPSPVTLLGDAIHNMTPMAGIGANTALRDADELHRALSDAGSATLIERIGRYERRMRGYANEALALSTRNARNAASTQRLPRLAFRTLLKLTDVVPPVKRAVFPATARARETV